jgi:prophage regulatory protein|tara:strand:+ start:374 stop:586 length:213 start_codon:yes stop_codon:yes gene_type:complete
MNKQIKFLRLPEVRERVTYSAPQIWRLEKANKFPKRVQIGENRVAWIATEIEEWITSKIQKSRGQNDGTI